MHWRIARLICRLRGHDRMYFQPLGTGHYCLRCGYVYTPEVPSDL